MLSKICYKRKQKLPKNEFYKSKKNKEKRKECQKEWFKKEWIKIEKEKGAVKKSNTEKIKARRKLNNAVITGKIIKPTICSVCGKTDCKIEGHHFDYSKPLKVIWVCRDCHRSIK